MSIPQQNYPAQNLQDKQHQHKLSSINTFQSKNNNNKNENLRAGDYKTEVHFIGQITGGLDYETTDGIFCEMLPDCGENWDLLQPQEQTYITQTCYADVGQMVVWNHPFDLHFSTKDIKGWPNAVFKIWRLDQTNKIDILAYGIVPMPKTSGYHKIYCNTWSPMGDWKFESLKFFLGSQPQIPKQGSQQNSIPYSIVNNEPKRAELLGISNGKILLEVECILKNFTLLSTSGDNTQANLYKYQDQAKNTDLGHNHEKQINFWQN